MQSGEEKREEIARADELRPWRPAFGPSSFLQYEAEDRERDIVRNNKRSSDTVNRSMPFPGVRRCDIPKLGAIIALGLSGYFAGTLIMAQSMVPMNVPISPEILPGTIESGQTSVKPDSRVAGEYGTWVVTYRAGRNDICTGGGLRVQLPADCFAGPRNSPIAVQATEPNHPNYVSATCSNAGVELQTTVELQPEDVFSKVLRASNLTRAQGYYEIIVRVVLLKGEMREGDTLSIVYGDRSQGSKGMRAGVVAGPEQPTTLAIDTAGRGQFRRFGQTPRLSIRAGLPTDMILTTTSQVLLGQVAKLHLALVDRFRNPAAGYSGDITMRLKIGRADIPEHVHFDAGHGWKDIAFTPRQEGLLRIEAYEQDRRLEALSNPIQVLGAKPVESLYWGEIHSHTRFSIEDGVGNPADAYDYARHVSGLDFYAMTDHARPPVGEYAAGLSQENYGEYNELADRFYAPDEFVTLHGYEASFYPPYGHVNVYFRGKPGPLLFPDRLTLPEMWKFLTPGEVLTIPHHTLKMPAPIDWTNAKNPQYRRNFEIYSAHGSSEEYDPSEPLAIEQSLFTNPSTSQKSGISAQDAWEKGYQLSTVASSDDHRSHPGQPGYGLTAVYAKSLTREDIFDALFHRRTYATTGEHIILGFDINGTPMGQETVIHGVASIHVRAIGTDIVDQVDLLRHISGKPGFQIIDQQFPAAEAVSFTFLDHPPTGQAVYYLRLRQRNSVSGRPVMAWSSPVWVNNE